MKFIRSRRRSSDCCTVAVDVGKNESDNNFNSNNSHVDDGGGDDRRTTRVVVETASAGNSGCGATTTATATTTTTTTTCSEEKPRRSSYCTSPTQVPRPKVAPRRCFSFAAFGGLGRASSSRNLSTSNSTDNSTNKKKTTKTSNKKQRGVHFAKRKTNQIIYVETLKHIPQDVKEQIWYSREEYAAIKQSIIDRSSRGSNNNNNVDQDDDQEEEEDMRGIENCHRHGVEALAKRRSKVYRQVLNEVERQWDEQMKKHLYSVKYDFEKIARAYRYASAAGVVATTAAAAVVQQDAHDAFVRAQQDAASAQKVYKQGPLCDDIQTTVTVPLTKILVPTPVEIVPEEEEQEEQEECSVLLPNDSLVVCNNHRRKKDHSKDEEDGAALQESWETSSQTSSTSSFSFYSSSSSSSSSSLSFSTSNNNNNNNNNNEKDTFGYTPTTALCRSSMKRNIGTHTASPRRRGSTARLVAVSDRIESMF